MQYYSKTPRQLQEEREASAEKSNRRYARGRVILLIDIALVILIILFYQSSLKDVFSTREQAMKNFQWKNRTIEAGCSKEGQCRIEIKGDDLEKVSAVRWQLKDKENRVLIEEAQILERAEAEGVSFLAGGFKIPEGEAGAQLYVQLIERSSGEQVAFRVYP